MIPGLDTAWVSVATRALETHSRLRRAIERVVEFGSPSMYLGVCSAAKSFGDGNRPG